MTKGRIIGIISNLATTECDGPVAQNEICRISHGETWLLAEVIRVNGNQAFIQIFESSRGLRIGTRVEFMGKMLEIDLAPGLLMRKYDGLQNDLEKFSGLYIQRGEQNDPLDANKEYEFNPIAREGDTILSGHWLGSVKENWIDHKVMAPFTLRGKWTVAHIATSGLRKIDDEIAVIRKDDGEVRSISMRSKHAVKIPINAFRQRERPSRLLETGIRSIDTLNPMMEGGVGFIPGPFGCGKTVLQQAMSKYAAADIIIMVACGERANEVVEIFEEYPELDDPRSGRKLMERTVIICNTSNMPVASREASVYTGMTIAEYYRSMGLSVLLLADSTSRWAQALREMSNRLEELPGPDAFPMDLTAIISSFYARAGTVRLHNGQSGAITFVGTVSPAGGNFKEPVTESTKKATRSFYALSQVRADKKRYPAIDPLESYSKYLEYPELREYLEGKMQTGWIERVEEARYILRRGLEAHEQINILGDDSVPLDYHYLFWKSELIDFTILQQDAFDEVDCSTSMERQEFMLILVLEICEDEFNLSHFEEIAGYFKQLIHILAQMNYAEFLSKSFISYQEELRKALLTKVKSASADLKIKGTI